MTTVPPGSTTKPVSRQDDPYRYGWRYVERKLPGGKIDFDQVSRTLEDVLHPEEGDFIVQTDLHERLRAYFASVFPARLEHDPATVVLSDVRIAWDVPTVRPMGPDIAVIFGVRGHKDWGTLDCAVEGTRPALVVEVTLPTTRRLDLRSKRTRYYRAEVPLRRLRGEQ